MRISWQGQHFGHGGDLRRALISKTGAVSHAQYSVDLELHISWRAQCFVDLEVPMSSQAFCDLEVQISWQAQYFALLARENCRKCR